MLSRESAGIRPWGRRVILSAIAAAAAVVAGCTTTQPATPGYARAFSPEMPIGRATAPPSGLVSLCLRSPDFCRPASVDTALLLSQNSYGRSDHTGGMPASASQSESNNDHLNEASGLKRSLLRGRALEVDVSDETPFAAARSDRQLSAFSGWSGLSNEGYTLNFGNDHLNEAWLVGAKKSVRAISTFADINGEEPNCAPASRSGCRPNICGASKNDDLAHQMRGHGAYSELDLQECEPRAEGSTLEFSPSNRDGLLNIRTFAEFKLGQPRSTESTVNLALASFQDLSQPERLTVVDKPTFSVTAGRLDYDPSLMKLISRVNTRVNSAIQPETDKAAFGRNEYWTLPISFNQGTKGDCEDYALEKRQALIAMGIPVEAMYLAVGYSRLTGRHSVLVVATTEGDFVLDSAERGLKLWNNTRYRWESRQVGVNPLIWASVT